MVLLRGKALAAALDESDLKALGLATEKEFELVKVKQGIWVLTERDAQKVFPQLDELEQKITGLLKKMGLNERVEGVFEKALSKEELEKFKQLLKQGKVIRFKLSPNYKKAVYKLPEDLTKKKPSAKELLDKENIEDYSLGRNGFLVVRNDERAKRLSEELKERIKNCEVRGTKSFDGSFYIIETDLLGLLKEKISALLVQKKNMTVQEIAKALAIGVTPVKIACEFLKEEGAVFEKKKEMICYIE